MGNGEWETPRLSLCRFPFPLSCFPLFKFLLDHPKRSHRPPRIPRNPNATPHSRSQCRRRRAQNSAPACRANEDESARLFAHGPIESGDTVHSTDGELPGLDLTWRNGAAEGYRERALYPDVHLLERRDSRRQRADDRHRPGWRMHDYAGVGGSAENTHDAARGVGPG